MYKKLIYSLMFPLSLFVSSCSDAAEEVLEDKTEVEFNLTRSSGNYDFRNHMNRVYVGERKQEHSNEELHYHSAYNLYSQNGNDLQFRITGLEPQWYKFIVLSVPKIYPDKQIENEAVFTEEVPGNGSCDLNQHMINYLPILQKGPGSKSPEIVLPDGDVYREVINRWARGHLKVSESFTLKRLNGMLVLDMGILADQFEHAVKEICVELETPTRLYITDDNKGNIKTATTSIVRFTTYPEDFSGVPEAQRKPHIISMNLLPGPLKGKIQVTTNLLEKFSFDLSIKDFVIKANTRTFLKFNGIYDGFFDVKYAGYEDTKIDVEDEWNGGW